MKQKMKFTTSSAFFLALVGMPAVAMAGVSEAKAIQDKINSIELRRGLDMEISIKSQYLRSSLTSDQLDHANNNPAFVVDSLGAVYGAVTTPTVERNGFTQLDLAFRARPWDAARGNVYLRFLSGYEDFFNNPTKNVSVSWMDLQGNVGKDSNQAFYQFGNIRSQMSPLTIWAPDVDVMYEAEVFRRQRHMAKSEQWIEGNARNLQGGQVQYRGYFGPFSPRIEFVGARLRTAEQLDAQGATGNILPLTNIAGASQSGNMDKVMWGANLEALALSQYKGIYLGVSYLDIHDIKSSLVHTRIDSVLDDGSHVPTTGYYTYNSVDTLPQQTSVMSFRLGADGAVFIAKPELTLNFLAEYAQSTDRDALTLVDEKGTALLGQVVLGYSVKGTVDAKMDVDYVSNQKTFFNNLAQSPSFVPQRVLNSDMDPHESRYTVRSPFYSTFDALYHFSPKFSPAPVTLSTAGLYNPNLGTDGTQNSVEMSGSQNYQIAPYSKNSYSTAVLTESELGLVSQLMDPTLQTTLPNGLATANRDGLRLKLTTGVMDSVAEVTVLFTSLKEKESALALAGFAPMEFSEIGGGLKFSVANLLGWSLPLEVSGSYQMNEATSTGPAVSLSTTSNFLNVGIYGRFQKRFGLFAGMQSIDLAREGFLTITEQMNLTSSKQMQWMAGMDYTLSKNAWVSMGFGWIDVTNEYSTIRSVDGYKFGIWDEATATFTPVDLPGVNALTEGYLLPGYYDAGIAAHDNTPKNYTSSFRQTMVESSINVDF